MPSFVSDSALPGLTGVLDLGWQQELLRCFLKSVRFCVLYIPVFSRPLWEGGRWGDRKKKSPSGILPVMEIPGFTHMYDL